MPPKPGIATATRLLLQFYVTIFGHFKGKSPKNYFTRLWRGKIQVFQAPTGYSTADKAFIAVLCDNIWPFYRKKPKKKIGYPPIASKAVGLATYRKIFLVMTE